MNLLKISDTKIVNMDLVTDVSYFPDDLNYKTVNGQSVEVIGKLTFFNVDTPCGHVYGEEATRIWNWLCKQATYL